MSSYRRLTNHGRSEITGDNLDFLQTIYEAAADLACITEEVGYL